ncbi:MAG: hypothetical protein V4754_02765 [Pseudomonadota bacterium]
MTNRHIAGGAMAAVLTLAAWASTASAQALIDPTEPPPEAALARPGADPSPTTVAPQQGPILQSVLVSRRSGGRRLAVIDGRTWRQGELFDGARLVKVSETQVVLQRGGTSQVLKLFADAPAVAAATPTPRALPAAVRQ